MISTQETLCAEITFLLFLRYLKNHNYSSYKFTTNRWLHDVPKGPNFEKKDREREKERERERERDEVGSVCHKKLKRFSLSIENNQIVYCEQSSIVSGNVCEIVIKSKYSP